MNAQWESTRAGFTAVGNCTDGFVGTPQRACQLNGQWNSTIINPCSGTQIRMRTYGH